MSVYKIEITSVAEEEYSAAFHYYESKQRGMGSKLEEEAEDLIIKLKSNPYLFQRKYKHYREAVLKRFPYYIVYEILNNSVVVHSFFHARRNPKSKLKGTK